MVPRLCSFLVEVFAELLDVLCDISLLEGCREVDRKEAGIDIAGDRGEGEQAPAELSPFPWERLEVDRKFRVESVSLAGVEDIVAVLLRPALRCEDMKEPTAGAMARRRQKRLTLGS